MLFLICIYALIIIPNELGRTSTFCSDLSILFLICHFFNRLLMLLIKSPSLLSSVREVRNTSDCSEHPAWLSKAEACGLLFSATGRQAMAVAAVGPSAQHGPRAPRLPIFLLLHPGHGVLSSCCFLMVQDGYGCRHQPTRKIANERR